MISFHQISTECGTWVLTPPAELCPDCARYVREQGPEGCFKWRTLWYIRALGVHALVIVVHFCVLDVHLPGMKERNGTVRNSTMQSDRKLRKKVKEKVLSNAENRLHLPTQRVQLCAQYKMGKNVSEYKKSLWVFWPIDSHLERAKGEKYQMQIQQEAKQGERTK